MNLPATIPLLRDAPDGAGAGATGLPGVALGLLLLLALGWVVWQLWRTRARLRQGPAGGAALRVLGTTRLTPGHSLHEVQWQGQRLLIGCTDHTVTLVASTPPAGPAAAPAQP